MKIIAFTILLILLTQTYTLKQLTHEQAPAPAPVAPASIPAVAPTPAAPVTPAPVAPVAPVTPAPVTPAPVTPAPIAAPVAPATPAAAPTAAGAPTEADLSPAEKQAFTKWQSNQIPWAKVKGKDVSATFNEQFKSKYVAHRIRHLIGKRGKANTKK